MRRTLLLLSVALAAAPSSAQDAPTASATGATAGSATEAPAVPAVTTAEAPRRARSLYADLRAFQAGDLITVVLAEQTQARRASASQSQSSASVGGAGSLSSGNVFGVDAQVSGRRDSDNATAQSELLTGTLTARVVSVDAAGNLAIDGERRLDVDGATHLLRVRGLVRPADVTTGNTVLSYHIASADVAYRQEGGGPRFLRPRLLTTIGLAAVVVAAAVLGGAVASSTPAPVAAAP